jgi:integrase
VCVNSVISKGKKLKQTLDTAGVVRDVPLSASIFVADHLRSAAKKTGVHIEDGQRFGLHNLRHSLSNWLVNKAKTEPKTVQGILRHARIQTTLDLYTQDDSDETRAAQGEYLTALGVKHGPLRGPQRRMKMGSRWRSVCGAALAREADSLWRS